jgi:hypothetical protein
MTVRLFALPLLLLSPLLLASTQQATAVDAEEASGFDGPLSDIAEAGFAIAAMVANLKVCGANEQQLTAFYNREKQRGMANHPGQAGYSSQFDAGFVQGRSHMAVMHQRGHAMPDAKICQALWYRYNQQ